MSDKESLVPAEFRLPTDSTQLVEYYMKRMVELLEQLIRAEQQGLRMRAAKTQLRKVHLIEWEEGIALIVRRLDQAPQGMLLAELQTYMHNAGYERFSKNLTVAKARRKNPMDDLVKKGLVFVTRDGSGGPRSKRRYWTRQWYLRAFASLPDAAQQMQVEESLNPVDNLSDDE
jgi:hypothetical protein